MMEEKGGRSNGERKSDGASNYNEERGGRSIERENYAINYYSDEED